MKIMSNKSSGNIQWQFEQICRDKDIIKLEELIRSGWNVNTKFYTSRWGDDGAIPLQLAVRDVWLEGVLALLKAGAQTWHTFQENYGERWSRTCLMHACHINHLELVKALVEYGNPTDVNIRDRYQHFSPLMETLYVNGDTHIIKYLLEKGAHVDIIGYKKGFFIFPNSPLTVCIKRGNVEALKLLINFGVNLHVTPREYISSFSSDNTTVYDIPYILGQYRNTSYRWGCDIVCRTIDLILKNPQESIYWKECLRILLEAGCSPTTEIFKNNSRVQELYSQILFIKTARPLKWLCRRFLRMDQGLFKPIHVTSLPIPKPVQKYILCTDL